MAFLFFSLSFSGRCDTDVQDKCDRLAYRSRTETRVDGTRVIFRTVRYRKRRERENGIRSESRQGQLLRVGFSCLSKATADVKERGVSIPLRPNPPLCRLSFTRSLSPSRFHRNRRFHVAVAQGVSHLSAQTLLAGVCPITRNELYRRAKTCTQTFPRRNPRELTDV